MSCRLCFGSEFREVIDFGQTPLVNSLLTKEECGTEKTYPLMVDQCQDCHLVQIIHPISTEEIYQAQDYLYYTGDMPTTDAYFKEFADDLHKFLDKGDLVVEIGSNDGTMLKNFENKLGVDPSTNVVIRALAQGIPTLSAGFDEHNAINIAKEFGKAKIIGGANCIAHIDDIHSLVRGVAALLRDDGVFWVECNYWGSMVKNKNYALIYHDHFSYFTLQNWMDILEPYGLKVFDAIVTDAQGGSLRLYAGKDRERTYRCSQLWEWEVKERINTTETALQYGKDVREEAKKLKGVVDKIKSEGKTIAGYGAAAKGFSVLHLAGITNEIEYFIDDSPAKQGKYTPVTHIPVVKRENAKPVDYFFITAPNYQHVIMQKERDFHDKGGRFITVTGEII